jgi:hypothetical protein
MDFNPNRTPVLIPPSKRTVEYKRKAEQNHTASHLTLRNLQRKVGNKQCADCTSRITGWAVLPHGIYVRINCAQVHRSLGRHISIVKAISTGTYTWYPDEIAVMEALGNERVNQNNSSGAPTKPQETAPRSEHEKYIRNKYEKRLWQTKKSDEVNGFSSLPPNDRSNSRKTLEPKKIPKCKSNPKSSTGWKKSSSSKNDQKNQFQIKSNQFVSKHQEKEIRNVMDCQKSFQRCSHSLPKPLLSQDFFAQYGL